MKFVNECSECAALWREYAASTTEHIRLESKLKIAALAREAEKIMDLTIAVEVAADRRSADREAIKAHEDEKHAMAVPVRLVSALSQEVPGEQD